MSHPAPAVQVGPIPRRSAGFVVALVLVLQGCGGTVTPEPPATAPSRTSTSPSTTPAPGPTTPPYQPPRFVPAAHEWLTQIPDDLRVDGRLPDDGGDSTRSRQGVGSTFCDVEAFSSGSEVLDRRTASASGPEYGESRDLRVFADDRAAHRFQRQVLAALDACPEQVMGTTRWLHQVRPSALGGDESFTVLQTFENDGLMSLGANFWEVVRVGNAVLLTATGGEYEPTTNLDPGIRHHAGDVATIVEEMCVFDATPCDHPPVAGTSTQTPVVGPQGPRMEHIADRIPSLVEAARHVLEQKAH